jgi:hypothetical protein
MQQLCHLATIRAALHFDLFARNTDDSVFRPVAYQSRHIVEGMKTLGIPQAINEFEN